MNNILKQKRRSLGYSLQQIADKLGVSDVTISRYENCKRFPYITELLAIASAYQLTDEELLQYINFANNYKK